jgi:hypothetical protein
MTLSKEDCVKKVQDLNNKIQEAETKAKDMTDGYLKKNPEFTKYRSAIQTKLKKYYLDNPMGVPVLSVMVFGKFCRVLTAPLPKGERRNKK